MRPTISLHGSGETVTLSHWGGARFVLMQGATGLGWGPHELTSAGLAAGGSVLRHRRVAEPEVMIPVLLGGDYGQRFEGRRLLERLCDGEVEVRVTQDDGSSRSRYGYLADGLGGDYGAGEDSHDGQKFVLTFRCPDQNWYGGQREIAWSLDPPRKPFISKLAGEFEPARVVRTNRVLNPDASSLSGIGVVSSNSALESRSEGGVAFVRVERTTALGGQLGVNFSTDVPAESLRYGASVRVRTALAQITVRVQRQLTFGWGNTATTTVTSGGGWTDITLAETNPGTAPIRIQVIAHGTSGVNDNGVGTTADVDRASLIRADHGQDFFSGNSTNGGLTYEWAGNPGNSVSEEWQPARTDGTMSAPFLPVMITGSTVQGSEIVEVGGDAPASAVIVVTGPGEDLEVVNESTGEKVFLEGEITEPITIDSRPRVKDVYSASSQDGELWDRISDDSSTDLISLQTGRNRIRASLVNVARESRVQVLWQETFKAGH